MINGVEPTKNQRKGALNDMIDKVEFTAKNLASNAGVLLLLLKTLICGGLVGADKLKRFLLLKADPLIEEWGINVREPEEYLKISLQFQF